MPTLERAAKESVVTLSGFSGNGYRVGQAFYPEGVIIWPEAADSWVPPAFDALAAEHFKGLEAADPPLDLLLVGTGSKLKRPSRALAAAFAARGIGVEPMDSRAAARTYNLLAGEGRRVAAALYPLDA